MTDHFVGERLCTITMKAFYSDSFHAFLKRFLRACSRESAYGNIVI